ncbi:hypothetical protein [Streptomyces sp. 891-h]|uniref:hypothetical protein n=1 Tax=Streptomyces sp. 891-h TaxID=2720714 RepID=UPI001FA94764|nr:hypothetical protein [Streptomyces sp. 891-h]
MGGVVAAGRVRWWARFGAVLLVAVVALGGGAGAGVAADDADSPAGYLAAQLRKSPVYLSDQLPRTNPLSARPAFVKEAKRTGVPTYVLVLPGSGVRYGDGLLAAVHDRLGKDGLYLQFGGDGGRPEVATFGVDVPARAAASATTYELPYDAGTLETFRHFVDVLRSGQATERAERGGEAGEEPDKLYTSRTDRANQSFLTGILLTGVPLLIVAVGWYTRRWRGGKGPGLRLLVPVAAATALAIGVGAPLVFDDTRSDGDPVPTAADMRARTDRLARAMRSGPVHVDPLAAGLLSRGELGRLRKRAERLDVPVHLAVVPLDTADESAGDGELLAKKLHSRLGSRGDGVYVIADAAADGELEIVNYGAKVDSAALYDATEDLRFGTDEESHGASDEESGEESDDGGGRLFSRLDEALRIIDRLPSAPPGDPYLDPLAPDDPVTEDELPALYSGDLVPGTLMGAVAAPAALGVTAAGLGIARRTGLGKASAAARRAPGGAGRGAASGGGTAPQTPARPSTGWLRRTARRELDELNDEFERLSDTLPDAARTRVWDCLDAATLLLDQEGDNRVDADADAPTLAAGLALIRAGRGALDDGRHHRGSGTGRVRLCTLNPLHGPATATGKLKLPGETSGARSRPVCAGCRAALHVRGTASPSTRAARTADVVGARLLCLRAPGAARSAPYEPYHRVPGPLEAPQGVGGGQGPTTEEIVRRVREQLGVH